VLVNTSFNVRGEPIVCTGKPTYFNNGFRPVWRSTELLIARQGCIFAGVDDAAIAMATISRSRLESE
jgi:hypothetical protein